MNVLVFKVSSSSEFVPDYQEYISTWTCAGLKKEFVLLNEKRPEMVTYECERWPIKKFSEYYCEASESGFPSEHGSATKIDTYIAIDPRLEEFLSIEYRQKIIEANHKAKNAEAKLNDLKSHLNDVAKMPWYKRALLAVLNKKGA